MTIALLLRPFPLAARRGFAPLLWASVLLAVGCGKADGPVRAAASGKVTLDGAPLKAGVVRFVPTGVTRGPVAAATVKDGAFELPRQEGPVAGTNRVEIEMLDHWGFPADDEAAFVRHFEKGPRQRTPANPIPETYNRRSTLTAEVQPDEPNKFSFDLQSSGSAVSQK